MSVSIRSLSCPAFLTSTLMPDGGAAGRRPRLWVGAVGRLRRGVHPNAAPARQHEQDKSPDSVLPRANMISDIDEQRPNPSIWGPVRCGAAGCPSNQHGCSLYL